MSTGCQVLDTHRQGERNRARTAEARARVHHVVPAAPAAGRSALESELELELTQPHMTQKPVLRGEVGARALRSPEGRGKGRKVVHTSEFVAAWWDARACM